MIASSRPGFPLMLYILLVLLFAPMIALGGLWAWAILAGFLDGPDISDLRGVAMMWMTILLAGAAICFFGEVLLVPYVLGLAKMRRHWLTAPISLIAGLFAGAAAYVFMGGSANPIRSLAHASPELLSHGSVNWPLVAPIASALVFALAAAVTAWILRPREGEAG
jgi:hypothetical protein